MGPKAESVKIKMAGDSIGTVRGTNQSNMRAANERVILTYIWRNGPSSKADIARQTGLSAQAISVIVRQLQADELVLQEKPVRGQVGQPRVPISLNPNGAFSLGLKVGRRSVEMVLMDFRGEVRARERESYEYPTVDAVLDFASYAAETLRKSLPSKLRTRICGMGLAMPFQLWDWAKAVGVEDFELSSWKTRDVVKELTNRVGLSVILKNDGSVACEAELALGAGRQLNEFVYFYLGFFIGGGLVINRTLFSGRTLNAGALGSTIVPDGAGGQAQLIEVASLNILERMQAKHAPDAKPIWNAPESWELDEAVQEKWVERAAQGIAIAILSCAAVIDVEAAIIDGWMPRRLQKQLTRSVMKKLRTLPSAGIVVPEVISGTVGPDARLIGAGMAPLANRYFVQTLSA